MSDAPPPPVNGGDDLQPGEPEDAILATEHTRELAQELAEQLYDAVRVGDVESARSLLQRGARRDEEDDDGKLPIHVAASRRDGEMIALLVASGASIDELDADGKTQLYCEAERNDTDGVSFLLSHSADVDAKSLEAKTALFAAAERGFAKVVRRLMEANADVNAEDLQQRTPLSLAAKNGHLPCVQLLTASTDPQQALGRSPLLLAASNGHLDVVEYLLERNPASIRDADSRKQTALHAAVSNNRSAVATVLIEKHADVDAKREPDGATALHIAAQRGFMDIVKLLIVNRAFLDGKQGDGKTALQVAVEHENTDVAQELVNAGASVKVQDAKGSSPLFVAVSRGHLRIVNLLIGHGAPVNATDAMGRTVLMAAAKHGRFDIAKRLISHGAAVDATQEYGRSALMIALSNRHREIARWLLKECGASVEVKDRAGWTPLHVAAVSRGSAMIELLIRKGAKVDAKNQDGKTALDLAVEKGCRSEVDVFTDRAARGDEPPDYTALLMTAAHFGRLSLMMALRYKGGVALHREASGDIETVLLSLARWGRHIKIFKIFKIFFNDSFKYALGGNAVLLRDTLARMRELCADVKESEEMFDSVVARLKNAVENSVDAIRASDEIRTELAELVYRFCRQLLQYRRHSTIPRFMTRRSANMTLRDFHSEIDGLLRRPELQDDKESWRDAWESFEAKQLERYQAALENGVLQELPIEAEQVKAAMHLKFMLTNRSQIGSTEAAIAERVIQQLVDSCGEDSVVVPAWFLSRFDVEFDRWSRVKAGKFVKTKWMSSNVNILTSSLNLAQFHDVATAWKQLKHSNVVDLFGACHVGEPRFLVCDSLQDECLKVYLCKKHDQVDLFSKLHEVTQGLLFLHERGIVLGNLTSDQILVGVDGKAKIGGFERGVLVDGVSHGFSRTNTDWTAPEVQRGADLPTAESDIFSFGVCVLDMLTMRDSWRVRSGDSPRRYLLCSSSSPPPSVPNRKHWILIKQMCAPNPARRVGLRYVMATLESFKEQAQVTAHCKSSSRSPGLQRGKQALPQDACTHLMAWNSIPDRLPYLKERCSKFLEARELAEFVHLRLDDVFALLMAKKLTPEEKVVVKFVKVFNGFDGYLKMSGCDSSYTRRARSQRITFGHEGFHQKIDELLELLRVSSSDKGTIHDWKSKHHELAKKLGRMSYEESGSCAATNSQIVTSHNVKSLKRDLLDKIPAVSVRSTLPHTKDWFIDLSKIELDGTGMFADGGFGKVYRGIWMPGTPVVVKFLTHNEDKNEDKMLQKLFLHEVNIWYSLRHGNVVRLWGACDIGKRYFVCEDAVNGTLIDYLKASAVAMNPKKLRELAWKLLHQAALGLQFCHERNVIHNDLKCDNILIGADGMAKLSDFGLSSMPGVADLTFEKTSKMGAREWKAPEYIEDGKPSFASDIFSFAMCIVEAMCIVDPETRSEPSPVLKIAKIFMMKGKQLPTPASMRPPEWRLAIRMTTVDPSHRINIKSVVEQLQVVAEEAEDRDVTEI